MTRSYVELIHLDSLEVTTAASGSQRRTLMSDEATGGRVGWSRMPPGWASPYGKERTFEMHSNDEEVFILEGLIHFGPYYTVHAGTYLNHPPFWVHPSEETNGDVGTTLLSKTSARTDFHFEAIPENWDGQEYFGGEPYDGVRGKGLTSVDLLQVPNGRASWGGRDLGIVARTLSRNPRDGWTTWLEWVPAGWCGEGDPITVSGGAEGFVLTGGMESVHDGGPFILQAGDYWCHPDTMSFGGREARSADGMLAIRWTRDQAEFVLPDPL